MPLHTSSRIFLTGALAHLALAGGLLAFTAYTGVLGARWDAFLWLLLMGFLAFSTLGFALHLFPAVARRPLHPRTGDLVMAGVAETGTLLGFIALSGLLPATFAATGFALAAGLLTVTFLVISLRFAGAFRTPPVAGAGPPARPADFSTIPLFLSSWVAAAGAGLLFTFSAFQTGPGFGWWIAGVHLFVLGHVVLLIGAVSLRMVPRSLAADPPPFATGLMTVTGPLGAILVPAGMLIPSSDPEGLLSLLAIPEMIFAVTFLVILVDLAGRAKTPRPQAVLHVAAAAFFIGGGTVALWMLSTGRFTQIPVHAMLGLLGFFGLTILLMWFGMIAPFQRVSHQWTKRMLWTLSAVLISGVAGFALSGGAGGPAFRGAAEALGALLVGLALVWAVGTLPVLFPSLNPLLGLNQDRIREIRTRWSEAHKR